LNCTCNEAGNSQIVQKLKTLEQELVEVARKVLKSASDPMTGVIRFLHERPENSSLPGHLINGVLEQTFGNEEIPGLIRILAGHAREVVRHANVIELIKEHPTTEKWQDFIIKQTDRVRFEVGFDQGRLVLKNINGLIGIEHGIELPLEKILINPPNLIVTVKMGMLRPQRVVSM
jgi:hypothetical protein